MARNVRTNLNNMVAGIFSGELSKTIDSLNRKYPEPPGKGLEGALSTGIEVSTEKPEPSVKAVPISNHVKEGLGDNQSEIDKTDGVADHETTNEADKIADNKTTQQAVEQAVGQASQQTSKQAPQQATRQVKQQLDQQPEPFERRIAREQEQQRNEQIEAQFLSQTSYINSKKESSFLSPEHFWLPLTERQGRVLFNIILNKGIVNVQRMAEYINIPYGTLRTSIAALQTSGFLNDSELFIMHKMRGVRYHLNTKKCSAYFETLAQKTEWNEMRDSLLSGAEQKKIKWTLETMQSNEDLNQRLGSLVSLIGSDQQNDSPVQTSQQSNQSSIEQLNQQVKQQMNQQVSRQVNRQVGEENHPFSSSNSLESFKKTTTQTTSSDSPVGASVPDQPILSGPEMAYWEDIGLSERQVQKWCNEFQVDPDDMRQQLAWARWDLECNGKIDEVKKTPIDWFFGALRKTAGCYAPAKGYLTPMELRATRLKAQRDAEQKNLKELSNGEAEERFQAVLADKNGEKYQELLASLPEVMKAIKGKALESALRGQFMNEAG